MTKNFPEEEQILPVEQPQPILQFYFAFLTGRKEIHFGFCRLASTSASVSSL